MVFVFMILKNKDLPENRLQLSPKSNLYKDKFSNASTHENPDLSKSGIISNVRINQKSGSSEPKIAFSPADPKRVAIASNDFSIGENFGRLFSSEDGGYNWSESTVPLSPKFERSSYSDPWIDFDSEGNLYFVAVQFDLYSSIREAIFFAKSTDNGNTWKSDYEFVDYNGKESIQLDRPKIYVEKGPGLKNKIYVSWIEVKGLNSFIMLSSSEDGGVSFSPPAEIEKDDVNYFSLNGNSVGEVFLTYVKDENRLLVKTSGDGGKSWSVSSSEISFTPAGVSSENQYLIKNSNSKGIRINSEPSVCFSPENDALICYTASGGKSDYSDIYFARLSKRNLEMTHPVRVNNDATANDQFLPSIASDKTGKIFITYQDSRDDGQNLLTGTYVSVSLDGGATFSDTKISTGQFDPLKIAIQNYFCDYNSCIISDDKLISVWTDGRNNNFDLYAAIFDVNEFISKMK